MIYLKFYKSVKYRLFSILSCALCAACTSSTLVFPREEVILQELMPLQGITCPYQLEV